MAGTAAGASLASGLNADWSQRCAINVGATALPITAINRIERIPLDSAELEIVGDMAVGQYQGMQRRHRGGVPHRVSKSVAGDDVVSEHCAKHAGHCGQALSVR